MGVPRIGRRPEPTPETVAPGDPAPSSALVEEDAETGTVHDFRELIRPLGVAPDPPRCVLRKLKSRDLVWRWLSEPSCKRLGMRMYETYSPDAKERELINSGKDAPPGVRVDAENRIRWVDDSFLGTIPRRYFLQRADMKRQRVKDQTKAAKEAGALQEAAQRAGGRLTEFAVKSWQSAVEDDREPDSD